MGCEIAIGTRTAYWLTGLFVLLIASQAAAAEPALEDSAASARIRVVAHPGLSIDTLTFQELRAIFSMRLREWPDGTPVKVFVLPNQHESHGRFCREILRVYPHQLQKGWDRLVYTGTGYAPDRVLTTSEMLYKVERVPGAIGYAANHDLGKTGFRLIDVVK